MQFTYTHRADLRSTSYRWKVIGIIGWCAAIVLIGGGFHGLLWAMVALSFAAVVFGDLPLPTDLLMAFLSGSVICSLVAPIVHEAVSLPGNKHALFDLCFSASAVLIFTGMGFAGGHYIGRGG